MSRYAHVAFTEGVREFQAEQGSRSAGDRVAGIDAGPDRLSPGEAAFIEARDGFYLGTVGETGWPYVQFRGGPPGFVHVIGPETLAFADVRGNRQYISNGNLRADDRVALFFMDYPRRARLKLFGHAETHDLAEHPDLADRLLRTRTGGKVERLVVIRVEGFHWNCPQHITPRFSRDELAGELDSLHDTITSLREENHLLRRELDARTGAAPRA